ncbi:MAG: hypothetical protein PHF46_05230, partial [Candidatus Gracilibacteria bacterium]|nr:hypothetical protein [Candidatus Gracilibacteria bacterium]
FVVIVLIIILFLSITIVSLYNPLNWGNTDLVKSVGEASFYIFSSFLLLLGLSFGAYNKEEKEAEDINSLVDRIKNIKTKLDGRFGKKIEINKKGHYPKRGTLFSLRDCDISIGYSLDDLYLENIWIDSKDCYETLKGIFIEDNAEESYGKKYSGNFGKTTIIPNSSKELSKKTDDEIVELIGGYINKIGTSVNKA